jgi:cell wall-associated NlpC family hydrolase
VYRWLPEQLRAGDVLLSQGNVQLSRLMAWNAECPYSHAAIMVTPDRFVEAAPPRVRCRSIDELAQARRRPRFVDVYRPVNPDGSELSTMQRLRIAEHALRWVGWPFARTKMAWLALQTLLQHKVGRANWRLPAPRHDRGFSCTEFVYRVLREAVDVELVPLRPRPIALPAGVITSDLCHSRSLRACGRLALGHGHGHAPPRGARAIPGRPGARASRAACRHG